MFFVGGPSACHGIKAADLGLGYGSGLALIVGELYWRIFGFQNACCSRISAYPLR